MFHEAHTCMRQHTYIAHTYSSDVNSDGSDGDVGGGGGGEVVVEMDRIAFV